MKKQVVKLVNSMIKIRFLGSLKNRLGIDEIAIEIQHKATLLEIINEVSKRYPLVKEAILDSKERIKPGIIIFINGVDANVYGSNASEIPIEDDSTIDIVPVVHGG